MQPKYVDSKLRLSGLGERAPPIHFTTNVLDFLPRSQMKEESPCALNSLRTALRIYNKRRIIAITERLNQIHRPLRTENKYKHNEPTPQFPLKLQNTHYSVLFCCLHRHLEQNSIGCLLWERRKPCWGVRCVSVVALTQEDIPVTAPSPRSPRLKRA